MMMIGRAAMLGLLLSIVSVPALAFNPACFCARTNSDPTAIQRYQVVRFTGARCTNERYPSGVAPWDVGVNVCSNSAPGGSQGGASTSAQLIPRCFCVRHVGGTGIQQYRVVSYPTVPQCRTAVYRENGKPAWENVLTCDGAAECYKADAQCQAKIKQLTANIAADPRNAVRTAAALQTWSAKCQSITQSCYVDLLQK